jgi:HTH-type transcriptional regulator, competence development regulator
MTHIDMLEQSNRLPIGILFRNKREEKGLLIRQVAAVTELDQAIISRIENCDRLPTKDQLLKLAGLYNLDIKETMSAWLAEKMVRDYGDEPYISEALRDAHDRVLFSLNSAANLSFDQTNLFNKASDNPDENKNRNQKPGRKSKKPDI